MFIQLQVNEYLQYFPWLTVESPLPGRLETISLKIRLGDKYIQVCIRIAVQGTLS